MRRDCPVDECPADYTPVSPRFFRRAGERSTDLVAVYRQMIQEHFGAVRAAPSVQVVVASSLVPQSPPRHSGADAELVRKCRKDCRMPKGVGTVQHRLMAAECGAVLPSLQQVAQEGLAGWNQFVTQDVPWADLEVALGHRTRDPLSPIRP